MNETERDNTPMCATRQWLVACGRFSMGWICRRSPTNGSVNCPHLRLPERAGEEMIAALFVDPKGTGETAAA